MIGKFLWGVSWRTIATGAVIAAPIVYANQGPDWSGDEVYRSGDTEIVGKPGVLIVALIQPEDYSSDFYENFVNKLFKEVIPFPVNKLVGNDQGVVLVDPNQPYMTEKFEPTQLADIEGSLTDVDGTPYIELYRQGAIRWEPPSASVAHDPGVFLYPGRKQGMRFPAAKTSIKVRYVYHAQLRDGKLPHKAQTLGMMNGALALLEEEHPEIVATAAGDAFDPEQLKGAVEGLLDSGIDTLVLASGQPIYSQFEDLDGSFVKIHGMVQDWRARNGMKPIKIVIPDYLAAQEEFQQLILDHFAAQVPEATGPGQKAMGIMTNHGLPPAQTLKDSWSARVDDVAASLLPRMEAILRAKGYAYVEAHVGAEGFADDLEDPEDKIVSVNELYRRADAEGFALAAAVPVDFPAENTDNLFSHATVMFDGFPGYETYSGPPLDTDWNEPYVRRFQLGKTTALYLGAPGGKTVPRQARAMADAVATVFGE